MRTFIAIEPSAQVRAALAATIEGLRTTPAHVGWVPERNLHLTAKFLGEVANTDLDAVLEITRDAAEACRPLPLEVRGVDFMPKGRRAKLVMADLKAPEALSHLVATLHDGCAPMGYPVPRRSFRPHLTLGRIRSPRGIGALRTAVAARADLDHGAFIAHALVVYESRLCSSAPVYVPLVRVPLGG